jgi:hypothetical protein
MWYYLDWDQKLFSHWDPERSEVEYQTGHLFTTNVKLYIAMKQIKIKFSSYKEIQKGAVAKSYITNGLLIRYMTKNLRISS